MIKRYNSNTERTAYVRFMRRFSAKRLGNVKPQLIERYADKTQRAKLFVDFMLCKEDLDRVSLMHRRRIIQRRKAKLVFRPMTRAQIVAKCEGDEEHADKKISEAVQNRRWRTDKLNPTCRSKILYWILDD